MYNCGGIFGPDPNVLRPERELEKLFMRECIFFNSPPLPDKVLGKLFIMLNQFFGKKEIKCHEKYLIA